MHLAAPKHDRRSFLRQAGLGVLVVAAPACLPGSLANVSRAAAAGAKWSDPSTWDGTMPGAGSDVVVDRDVVLDRNISVKSLTVTPSGVLTLDPGASIELSSTGNIVIQGRLVSRPIRGRRHRVVFTGLNESRFVGGGMSVLPTDVGLWVMGTGTLELAGAEKRAWTRATGSVAAGATEITLADDPSGWEVGDEIVLTPTVGTQTYDHHTKYDAAQISRIDGRTVGLSRATAHAHPAIAVGKGVVATAEVLNLTRNVHVEGTPGGRAHIFINSAAAQELRHVALRHLAPRRPADRATVGILGRYALHFHMNGAGSRGSIVEGVVARQIGSHAFVPHMSDGITFRDCVSHDTFDDPYWWDGRPDVRMETMPSNGLLWERCVASLVKADPPFRGYRLSGFSLGRGTGNVARNCVAVGVQGNRDASGFHWPEGSEGLWTFEGCTAHNNACNGIFTWQNTSQPHVIGGFLAYHNGSAGIAHGAYRNSYRYERCTLFGNKLAGVHLHAQAADPSLRFVDMHCDGAGVSEYGVLMARHKMPATRTTEFVRCHFQGHRRAAFGVVEEGRTNGATTPERLDLVHCTSEGALLWLANGIPADSRVRVQDARHGAIEVRRTDQPGTFRREWNATFRGIAPFSSASPTPG